MVLWITNGLHGILFQRQNQTKKNGSQTCEPLHIFNYQVLI